MINFKTTKPLLRQITSGQNNVVRKAPLADLRDTQPATQGESPIISRTIHLEGSTIYETHSGKHKLSNKEFSGTIRRSGIARDRDGNLIQNYGLLPGVVPGKYRKGELIKPFVKQEKPPLPIRQPLS
jgi:hypothetical protein